MTDASIDLSKRDRVRSPSINWPQTRDEAFRAVAMQVGKQLTQRGPCWSPLGGEFTTNAGLGQTRTQEQADWLNEARLALIVQLDSIISRMTREGAGS